MNNFKVARKSKNLRQKFVAKYLNVTAATYCRYETGVMKPTPETLISLAKLFDVSVDFLLGLDSANNCSEQDLKSIDLGKVLLDENLVVMLNGQIVDVHDRKIMIAIIAAYQNSKLSS